LAWPGTTKLNHVAASGKNLDWLKELSVELKGLKGVDGELDGLWTCKRGAQIVLYNSRDKPAQTKVAGQAVTVAPWTIWSN
jgi:hypothetical protein